MVRSILSSRLERFSGLQDGRIFGYRARGQLGLSLGVAWALLADNELPRTP
jgi:hypothetical protein